ncbi:DUF2793 domain-containing protein [Aurantiacibacter sediminis]|uniref:DUF2793 domain-containing protein n=1 Tax=Aurantiacibacter sediminis TaxID=2793064 RepID=A0ABS0N0Q6_9SPHN|nr:DUF2793 domain-containing protein [Aurantiacibacter sediminis]MBH5321545.1 DUF2793 domain-containing protein [Aurantiacibacter sediminis]
MTDPISFSSATPRFSLPKLFAAQAQKEVFVNEALARIDLLLHPVVEGVSDIPPSSPTDGESWIVGAAPTGDWIGHENAIASFQSGNWLFANPSGGMIVYDTAASASARFDNGWTYAAAISAPSGGSTQDAEARAAIAALIASLQTAGILPNA